MAQSSSYSYSTNKLDKRQIGQAVDDMMTADKNLRWSFERRWYDNNFFDDGYHFRYMSRAQDKIVDLSQASTIWAPMRSIPKASRQIRGVSNLLTSRNFIPVVYPEKVSSIQFPPIQTQNPQSGQMVMAPNPEYKKALEESKRVAKSTGHWLSEEFKKMGLTEKLAFMILLATKHGVSFIQIWPDPIKESLNDVVLDAFDIHCNGSLNELEDCPHLIKSRPRRIAEIKADERFDIEQVVQINPDNRYASSDIKEAYAKARYGGLGNADSAATVIEKEAFIKEYLDSDNMERIREQEDGGEILKRFKKGDTIIRQVFAAGNITLKDSYLLLPSYPIVDLRLEPGPIYQVPLLERLKHQNKSLDLVVSRVERYLHTMVTGSWSIKSGEPTEPNNTAGGQIFKYNTTPPVQNPIASVPPFVFNFMELLQSLIEEQGVTTSALGKLPKGVKANAAIETLKESEFANLSIPMERIKGTVRRISEKMLDYADDYFVKPQTVYYLEKGEPQYFDIIGSSALKKRKDLKLDENQPIDAIPIKRDYRVDIEVETGLAYTREGQRTAAKELGDYLIQLSQLGLVSPEVVKEYFRRLLEIYQFGSASEIMEAMDEYGAEGQMTGQQIDAMKVAMMEVADDLQKAGVLPTSEQRIEESKVAAAQVMMDAEGPGSKAEPEKGPSKSISFKDLPAEGKVQLAAQAGIDLSEDEIRQQEEEAQSMEKAKLAIQAKKGEQRAGSER